MCRSGFFSLGIDILVFVLVLLVFLLVNPAVEVEFHCIRGHVRLYIEYVFDCY